VQAWTVLVLSLWLNILGFPLPTNLFSPCVAVAELRVRQHRRGLPQVGKCTYLLHVGNYLNTSWNGVMDLQTTLFLE
jgi:hypothetical protein